MSAIRTCIHCIVGEHQKCDGTTTYYAVGGGESVVECACAETLPVAVPPRDALEAIRDALVVDVADSAPLHISDVYTHTGQAIVILDALAAAGYDLRTAR